MSTSQPSMTRLQSGPHLRRVQFQLSTCRNAVVAGRRRIVAVVTSHRAAEEQPGPPPEAQAAPACLSSAFEGLVYLRQGTCWPKVPVQTGSGQPKTMWWARMKGQSIDCHVALQSDASLTK